MRPQRGAARAHRLQHISRSTSSPADSDMATEDSSSGYRNASPLQSPQAASVRPCQSTSACVVDVDAASTPSPAEQSDEFIIK